MYGTTTYTLFAPEYAKDLYLYPSIHVAAKQSQVILTIHCE